MADQSPGTVPNACGFGAASLRQDAPLRIWRTTAVTISILEFDCLLSALSRHTDGRGQHLPEQGEIQHPVDVGVVEPLRELVAQ